MADSNTRAVVALVDLAEQVRDTTLQLLHVPDPAWLTWSPAGTTNHILWHGGHALWLQDVLTIQPLTGRSQLPRGWAAMFGQGSKPAAVQEWPSVLLIRDFLGEQLRCITTLLREHERQIAAWADEHATTAAHAGRRTPLGAMIHGWHDEARHQGEMYLLLKLCRAGSRL